MNTFYIRAQAYLPTSTTKTELQWISFLFSNQANNRSHALILHPFPTPPHFLAGLLFHLYISTVSGFCFLLNIFLSFFILPLFLHQVCNNFQSERARVCYFKRAIGFWTRLACKREKKKMEVKKRKGQSEKDEKEKKASAGKKDTASTCYSHYRAYFPRKGKKKTFFFFSLTARLNLFTIYFLVNE